MEFKSIKTIPTVSVFEALTQKALLIDDNIVRSQPLALGEQHSIYGLFKEFLDHKYRDVNSINVELLTVDSVILLVSDIGGKESIKVISESDISLREITHNGYHIYEVNYKPYLNEHTFAFTLKHDTEYGCCLNSEGIFPKVNDPRHVAKIIAYTALFKFTTKNQ